MLSNEIILRELQNYQTITLNQQCFGFLHLSTAHFCLMSLLNKTDHIEEWKTVIVDYFNVYVTLLENYPQTDDDKNVWQERFLRRLEQEMQEQNVSQRLAFLEQETLSLLHLFDNTESFQKQISQQNEEIPKYVWMVFERD